MVDFVKKIDELASKYNVSQRSVVYKYIEKKTRASGRDSKARRSLGNLYALYVLCEAYNNVAKGGTSFSVLMQRMRALPFGSKLQNHPLDNRLNDEVRRSFLVQDNMLPVQGATEGTVKKRIISIDFLSEFGMDPGSSSLFITKAIDLYIDEITEKQNEFLFNIENSNGKEGILKFIENSFSPNADARLFEVVSFSVLKLYFAKKNIVINGREEFFQLFKTGRTNANDGGIDFVLTPLGKFYQVTEVLDFRKYFLDFEKVNRFPISFVIKTDLLNHQVRSYIHEQAMNQYSTDVANMYMQLFDEIYTNVDLKNILDIISQDSVQLSDLKNIICNQFKLEYGLLD